MARAAKKAKRVQASCDSARRFTEESVGFLEKRRGELVTQREIQQSVNLISQSKHFELKLEFGPYDFAYTPNGRFVALCGQRGHVALFDHLTKDLKCEFNCMERANAITFFHNENYMAVAQKKWTYVYDGQGVELHCLKELFEVLRLEFLPFHFLLAAGTEQGFLHFLDVSTGKFAAQHKTFLGRLSVLGQNPATGVLHSGHANGTVSMWTPSERRPVVKLLAHTDQVLSITATQSGDYMATSGQDRKVKLWDLRNLKDEVWVAPVRFAASHMEFSQRNLLAMALHKHVQVVSEALVAASKEMYLRHEFSTPVHSLHFCPFEDVLGVGHGSGWTSLLVPGAGEPGYDALEQNPMSTKKQRQEMEVKKLLAKIPAELIAPRSELTQLDRQSAEEEMERKRKALFGETSKITLKFSHKKKGRSKAGRVQKKKQKIKLERRMFEKSEMLKVLKQEAEQKRPKAKLAKRPADSAIDFLIHKTL